MGKIPDERVDNTEAWAAKIVRRYENDVPVVKRRLRGGDDLILIAEIKRLRATLLAASALPAGEREPVEGCEYCVDGLQADGETACSCQEATDTNELLTASYMRGAIDAKRDAASEIEALRKEIELSRASVCNLLMLNERGGKRAESAEARLAEALKALEDEKIRSFNTGYVIACCNVSNLHNEPSIAADVLDQVGVTKAEVRAMDLSGYDTTALKEIERSRSQSPYAARRVREGGKADG